MSGVAGRRGGWAQQQAGMRPRLGAVRAAVQDAAKEVDDDLDDLESFRALLSVDQTSMWVLVVEWQRRPAMSRP